MKTTDRFLLTFAVMAATIMQVLDNTIANVALPYMAGELGATIDNISWVLTSYLVASSIAMPLTGYFSDRLGVRRYLLISIGGFVFASGLCGIATSLYEMVLFRLLQGLFGASLIPLSRAITFEAYPKAERGKAAAIWGMGVMVAPILGPTIGGYLTEVFNWRWVFYINLPIGALSLLLAARYVPSTQVKVRTMDWLGLASLALAVGALQLVLDRGQQEDWFSSTAIRVEAALAAAGFALFLLHSLRTRQQPLLDLGLFKDRNFALACLVVAAMGPGMFGAQFLQPLFMENLLGFPTMTVGLVMMPRGIGAFISMSVAGRFTDRISPKWMVLPGVLLAMTASYLMTRYNAQVGKTDLMVPLFLQGLGMGLIFVPLSVLAFATIPMTAVVEAAGIFSLSRSVGAAIGISATSSFLARTTEAQWSLLRGHVNPFNPAMHAYLQPIDLHPYGQGIQILARTVGIQAQFTAFVSSFWFITASFAMLLPLVLLLKERGPARQTHVAGVAERVT